MSTHLMGTAMQENEVDDDAASTEGFAPGVVPDAVEVRRHAGVAAGVGLTASAVAIAYFGRATQSRADPDWVARPK